MIFITGFKQYFVLVWTGCCKIWEIYLLNLLKNTEYNVVEIDCTGSKKGSEALIVSCEDPVLQSCAPDPSIIELSHSSNWVQIEFECSKETEGRVRNIPAFYYDA